jgi:hypothetical protein
VVSEGGEFNTARMTLASFISWAGAQIENHDYHATVHASALPAST